MVSAVCENHPEACVEIVVLTRDMTRLLIRVKDKFKARYRLDVNQVVNEYNTFLQCGLVTTSSFQNILDGKLNRRRRALQLTVMLYFLLYMIPRHSFLILLYPQDDKTRMYYQYILADYGEEMGMLGRTFNVCFIIFPIGVLINNIVMRMFEAQGSLEFLTDWLKRVPEKTTIEDGNVNNITAAGDLDNRSRHNLVSSLHYKLILGRIMAKTTSTAAISFELVAFPVFIYKLRPSLFTICLGLCNFIARLVCIEIGSYHFHSLYLSYIVTTDYFKVVIDNIIKKVEDLKTREMTNLHVTRILDDYDFMMNDFKKYNRVLKPLLGSLIHFYIFGMTCMFFMFTIETEVWMWATISGTAGGLSFVIFATGIYVSQLHAKVIELHNALVSLCARYVGSKRRLSVKCLFRLKHVVQELGSFETDGQFVIGLRDGEGAATSRMEIFGLTMETVTNTLMVLGFFNEMDGLSKSAAST